MSQHKNNTWQSPLKSEQPLDMKEEPEDQATEYSLSQPPPPTLESNKEQSSFGSLFHISPTALCEQNFGSKPKKKAF